MAKLKLFSLALIGLVFIKCDSDTNSATPTNTTTASITELASSGVIAVESTSQSLIEDVDQISDVSFDALSATSGGRIEEKRMKKLKEEGYGDCAQVTDDEENNIITVDFGDGCVDDRGRFRKGKIIITYSEDKKAVGAKHTVTFENYYADTIKIEGTKTKEITAVEPKVSYTEKSTLTGGKFTYPDGTTSTRASELTRVKYMGATKAEGYSTLEGKSSGTDIDGTSYNMEITEKLVFKNSCLFQQKAKLKKGGFVPVSGIKKIVKGDTIIETNFGDGTCDNLAKVTTNGVTEEIEIQTKVKSKKK